MCYKPVVSQTGAVQQTNEYYPFGDLFPTSGTDNSGNRFRFTGKELGAETGLYDFSARFLHPRFGRFTTLDPLAEKYPSVSPYAYCNCNPVRYIDPDGRVYGDYYSLEGKYITSDGIDDDKIYLVSQSSIDLYDRIINKTNDRSMAIRSLRKGSEEIGGLIVHNRKEDSSIYTMSTLTALGKDMFISGYILEPAGPSTPIANQNKRVPEGLYYLDDYSSPNYPSHFILYNDLVPKSRAILYHVGNTFKDTRGCMLPGSTYDGKGFVGRSTDKVEELFDFINTIGHNNIRVIINDYIQER